MPTVILLDVSLSMCRQASRRQSASNSTNQTNGPSIKSLATAGVGILCDYFSQNSQLENLALVVYSSLYEIKHSFSRDYDSIKTSSQGLEVYDKSNIVNALRGISTLKLDEYAQEGPVNVILITDGQLYNIDMQICEQQQSEELVDFEFRDIPLKELENLFNFDCKIQVVCLTSPRDPALKQSLPFFKRLVGLVDQSTSECPVVSGSNMRNYRRSAIWLPETNTLEIGREEVEALFTNLAESNYKPHNVALTCGHLSSMVMLSPKPTDNLVEPLKNEFDDLKNVNDMNETTFVSALNKKRLFELSDEISICGFLPLSEIASPAITSRHIVFPIANNHFNETAKAAQILSQDPNAFGKKGSLHTGPLETINQQQDKTKDHEETKRKKTSQIIVGEQCLEKDITKRPSFCVLLHNCLKQENMIAVCLVGKSDETNEEWFGILHPHTDSRKRSSLMLSLLLPGPSPILWLPNFKTLASVSLQVGADMQISAVKDRKVVGGAPNKSSSKSYSTNNVIWLDPESVQMDVQKIVRHAKRAPEKAPHFYKELNRIRRAAISYGFYDVLYGLASILEREKHFMLADQTKVVNVETIKHMDHVIACLRLQLNEESFETNIMPPT